MELRCPELGKTAGRRAAVVEKEKGIHPVKRVKEENLMKKSEKPTKNEFDVFGGLGSPPSSEPFSSAKMLEKDAAQRTPSASYRVPFKNLFLKSLVGKGNIFENGKKGIYLGVLDLAVEPLNMDGWGKF